MSGGSLPGGSSSGRSRSGASPAGPSLAGRVALVTGATRRAGIGFAVARELAGRGASLFLHHFSPYDREAPWAEGEPEAAALVADVARLGVEVADAEQNLYEPQGPAQLFARACERFAHVDILVANHAYSRSGRLEELSAESLDLHLGVNVRASLLLAREFARQHDDRPGGRIVLLTSGQHLGPMPDEIAYAASKGALAQIASSLADALAERAITVNCVNPGPTDTGWADAATRAALLGRMPRGRFGEPEDAARLIGWLCSDDAHWITGEVINSEGGFRR